MSPVRRRMRRANEQRFEYHGRVEGRVPRARVESKLFNRIRRGATENDCSRYRYRLWRVWNDELPLMVWVFLSPSTADANDKHIRAVTCW